jgi:hypothetical protein
MHFYGWWKSALRTSFGGQVKPSVLCSRFTACKRAWVRCFVAQISRPLLLTRDCPALLPDGSGCWIRLIRIVLRQDDSHLPLVLANLGYGTVLTAASTLQGCSATHSFIFRLYSTNSKFQSVILPPSPLIDLSLWLLQKRLRSETTILLTYWSPSTAELCRSALTQCLAVDTSHCCNTELVRQ